MSLIFFDTETTGISDSGPVYEGHRLVEVAAVICDDGFEFQEYQSYLNPQCEVSAGAFQVHGLSNDFLADYPLFEEQVDAFLNFIEGHTLIAHNAQFDIAFLNYELERIGKKPLEEYCPRIIDTLAIARKKYPGQKNSLDALCQRFQISLAGREFHGALKDCHLLQKVYRFLHGGQRALSLDMGSESSQTQAVSQGPLSHNLVTVSDEERQRHDLFVQNNLSS